MAAGHRKGRERVQTRWVKYVVAVVACAGLVWLAVAMSSTADAPANSSGGAAPSRDTSPATASIPISDAESLVGRLAVADEGPRAGYAAALFRHWTDVDGDGCDTRCEVLAAQRRTDLAGLPGGGWLSIYDGYTTSDPSELEIDHVVALAEAWDSGASSWDADRREAFANDPDELLAVTLATNRSKSDRDPAKWQPPNRDAWCQFGTTWTRVKLKWGLTADPAEVRALQNMLTGCP